MTGLASACEATPAGLLAAARSIPRHEALLLLAHASGRTRERLLAGATDRLPHQSVACFEELVARRSAGEPVAYLVGQREFYGRSFAIDARALIPRPETELLIDEALRWVAARSTGEPPRILDLGTGSGVIAITLALECPTAAVRATDLSTAALALAKTNAERLGCALDLIESDWYEALANTYDRVDLIVSNPPYIAADDPHLALGDLRFEPRMALTDRHDGLEAVRSIVAGAPRHLRRGGMLLIEHGHDQAASVRERFAAAGFTSIATARDLAGIERATGGRHD